MAPDDAAGGAPADRNLTDKEILGDWRRTAKALAEARVAYAQEYLRAKIRKESDGTAHQIATETTGALTTRLEADLDIIRAIWYKRSKR